MNQEGAIWKFDARRDGSKQGMQSELYSGQLQALKTAPFTGYLFANDI